MIPVALDYLLGIGALGLVGALMLRRGEPTGARWAARLAHGRPLTRDEALTGPPPPRRRRWGVQAPELRDWQRDADLSEVA